MIKFEYNRCPKCGKTKELMFSNNPLSGTSICFDCIGENLNYNNIEHADFFCRTYNLPFDPQLWIELSKDAGQNVFREYTSLMIEEKTEKKNLFYTTSTRDLWSKTNKEWEKCRSLMEILNRIEPIKESYIDRGRLKWGDQYTFEEIIKLDSIYTKTLKANSITNPLQKEAVKTLCKLQVEMDEAIRAKDAKAIKDFSGAWSTFAKQADLETMINETRTDDITTVAELYQYMEDSGFIFKYFQGADKDEVDRAITDIKEANRKLILESTGLQQLLEDMIQQQKQTKEEEYARQITEQQKIEDLLQFTPEDGEIATEEDAEALNIDFSEDAEKIPSKTVIANPEDL